MRIHLGHHFYGAGNLGDDFMLAGFLGAMHALAANATYTCCVPFALEPLQRRFPQITWLPYDETSRAESIRRCDVWLGLGGSPFQSALSRWFIDHLLADSSLCRTHAKSMFYLGVGVQNAAELDVPEVSDLCRNAAAIWTRDAASADRLARATTSGGHVVVGADLAHIYFAAARPPLVQPGRLTLVANFDYGHWAGLDGCLHAIDRLRPGERVWLAQESRELPGAEKALFAALPEHERAKWKLRAPDAAGTPLSDVLARWPTGEWLISSRYHAAIAGAWSGSKVVVVATNEKLRGVANELALASLAPDALADQVENALSTAQPGRPPVAHRDRAFEACRQFVESARLLSNAA